MGKQFGHLLAAATNGDLPLSWWISQRRTSLADQSETIDGQIARLRTQHGQQPMLKCALDMHKKIPVKLRLCLGFHTGWYR